MNTSASGTKQWPDFYSILDSAPDADSETLRRSINTLYVHANEQSDHRELSTRFYNQVLSQKVLPQCRSILLNERAREAYDYQWNLHREGAETALSYQDFIREITKGSGSASALLLSDNEIAILPTFRSDHSTPVAAKTPIAAPSAPPAATPIAEPEVIEGEEVLEPELSPQMLLTPPVLSAVVMAPPAPMAPKKAFPIWPVLAGLFLLGGIGGYVWNALRKTTPLSATAATAKSNLRLYTLARNSDFEVSKMASWVVSGDSVNNNPQPDRAKGQSVSGLASMVFYSKKPYNIDVRQTITGLKPGKYTMRAWAKQGKAPKVAEMFVEGYGGSRRAVPLPQGWTWTIMTLKDIQVTSGQCTIGFNFKSQEPTGGVGNVDAVEFFHQ